MKNRLLLYVPVLISMMLVGCGKDCMTGADMEDFDAGVFASGGAPPPSGPIIDTVPLLISTNAQIGNVQTWNSNDSFFVKITVDSGWAVANSQLAFDTLLSLIPQTKKGKFLPAKYENHRIYNSIIRTDTYAFVKEWNAGTNIYVSMHAQVKKQKKTGYGAVRSAWAIGNGLRYFTDMIEGYIIIITR
jgi:hypothetical protein